MQEIKKKIKIHLDLAKDLKVNNEFTKSIKEYEKALSLNPTLIPALLSLSQIYRRLNKPKQAHRYLKKIIETNPHHTKALELLAQLYTSQKNLLEAIKYYYAVLKIKPEQSATFYLNFGDLLKKVGDKNKAITFYKKSLVCIKSDSNLPLNVYQNLIQVLKGSPQEVDALSLHHSSKQAKLLTKTWNALNQTTSSKIEELYPQDLIKPNVLEVKSFFELTNQYTVINLNDLNNDDKIFLEKNKLSSDYLRLNQTGFISSKGADIDSSPENFHTSILTKGFLYAFCPTHGKIIQSCKSMVSNSPNCFFYRFVGDEVFYLIVGFPGNKYLKVGLYFPDKDLIINYRMTDQILSDTITQFKIYSIMNRSSVKSYLLNKEKPKIVLTIGHPNLGHYLVNVLSGLQKQIDLLKENNIIHKFLIHGTEFFGPINSIFPELPSEKIEYIKARQLGQEILEKNYFAFRVGEHFVLEKLVEKLYKNSYQLSSHTLLDKINIAKKCFPLIAISCRFYKRVWVSQITGLAKLIRKLKIVYPNIGIVFDGYSLGSSNLESDEKMLDLIEELIDKDNKAIQEILDLISDLNIPIFNTVGCRIHESVLWAKTVDLYIGSLGSNLTKNCTVANKPGIVHTNTEYMKSIDLWFTHTRESPNIPIGIPLDKIIDLEKEKGVNGNYDFDWNILYDKTLDIVPHLERKSLLAENKS